MAAIAQITFPDWCRTGLVRGTTGTPGPVRARTTPLKSRTGPSRGRYLGDTLCYFWVQMGCFRFCENNTGCLWQIYFPQEVVGTRDTVGTGSSRWMTSARESDMITMTRMNESWCLQSLTLWCMRNLKGKSISLRLALGTMRLIARKMLYVRCVGQCLQKFTCRPAHQLF